MVRKNNACSPRLVNGSFETYGTSAVPLLVRNVWYVCGAVARNLWGISKIKLKKHWFSEVNVEKVLLAAVPLTVVYVELALNIVLCSEPKQNQ